MDKIRDIMRRIYEYMDENENVTVDVVQSVLRAADGTPDISAQTLADMSNQRAEVLADKLELMIQLADANERLSGLLGGRDAVIDECLAAAKEGPDSKGMGPETDVEFALRAIWELKSPSEARDGG